MAGAGECRWAVGADGYSVQVGADGWWVQESTEGRVQVGSGCSVQVVVGGCSWVQRAGGQWVVDTGGWWMQEYLPSPSTDTHPPSCGWRGWAEARLLYLDVTQQCASVQPDSRHPPALPQHRSLPFVTLELGMESFS